jgi:hypothetical protein
VLMARRRELADVADGITGHLLWSIGATGFPFEEALGSIYEFDLIAKSARPTSRGLSRMAHELGADFRRHLSARSIPAEWAVAASLHITFGARTIHDHSLATCRVEVSDDMGRTHTSTRRGGVWLPGRRRPLSLLLSLLNRR